MGRRGIILAAGRGSRMGKQTESKPKCFTVLNGKRLLDWQFESLMKAGIKNISVVAGYKNEMFDEHINKYINSRWNETNMVASLFCADPYNGDTIISYSDIVYKSEHVSRLIEAEGEIVITADELWKDLWELRFENLLDDAETFKCVDSKLVEIGKKTGNIEDIEAQFMGLIKLTKRGWNIMFETYESLDREIQDKMDMTSLLNILLQKNIAINIVYVKGGWCEADEYSDIIVYEKMIAEKNNWKHDWR